MSITAQDRPGIVAGVSEAIVGSQGNIEAASQTVHQGYFAMIVLCAFDKTIDPDGLVGRIQAICGEDIHVYMTAYVKPVAPSASGRSFILTSIGPDQPGILHSLSRHLASRQINIDDLYCCVKGGDFVVICQVSVPQTLDIHMVQADLASAGQSIGITTTIQDESIFTAINELPFGRVK